LPPELVYLLRQFIVLHGHRPAGFGVSPIPLTEIEAYWRIYLKDDDVLPLHVFTDWITTLDEIVMQHEAKKPTKETTDDRPKSQERRL
jgi:hypothetical protein